MARGGGGGLRGARKIATPLFSEKSLRRGGFPENFLEIREKSRRTRPPRDFSAAAPRLPGGKVPGVPACPENYSGFFGFFQIPRTFPPRGPPVATFFTKSARKIPGFCQDSPIKSGKEKSSTVSFPGGGCFAPFRARWGRVRGAGLNAWLKLGNPAGSWDFWRPPGPAPGPGPGGPGKSRLFHFFPEESLRRGGFSGLFSGIREKSRRTRPPRDFFRDSGDFPGGKVPGVPVCPGNSSGFFNSF